MIFLIFLLVSQDVLASESQWNSFRIVGGFRVPIEEFPFMVFLSGPLLYEPKVRNCGASILSKKWAITAAHCYDKVIVSQMCFLAGTSSTLIGGSYHCTKNYHPHEKFKLVYVPEKSVHTSVNDIAAVEVAPYFPLDGVKVAPVPLPGFDLELPPGTSATVVGWGRLEEGGDSATELRSVEIFVISQEVCKQWYPFYYVDDQHLCAKDPVQWKGFCRGDSGGPLLVGGFLMGISTWTDKNCGDPTKPNVFSYVPYFRDWILKTTGL